MLYLNFIQLLKIERPEIMTTSYYLNFYFKALTHDYLIIKQKYLTSVQSFHNFSLL